jgi:hypothetical protein
VLNRNLPNVVYHADWGSDPGKRWIAKAVRTGNRYVALPPELVGDVTTLITRVRNSVQNGSAVIGFDFPIGIPLRYAQLVRAKNFVSFLRKLGRGKFVDFYNVCTDASQITGFRPFYPYKPGGTRQKYLLAALQASNMDQLRRQCDPRPPEVALPSFWNSSPRYRPVLFAHGPTRKQA